MKEEGRGRGECKGEVGLERAYEAGGTPSENFLGRIVATEAVLERETAFFHDQQQAGAEQGSLASRTQRRCARANMDRTGPSAAALPANPTALLHNSNGFGAEAAAAEQTEELADQQGWYDQRNLNTSAIAFRMQSSDYATLLDMYENRLMQIEDAAKREVEALAEWPGLLGEVSEPSILSGFARQGSTVPDGSQVDCISGDTKALRMLLNEKIVAALEQLDHAASNPEISVAAWRPNLSESAHEVLRAWINEHINNPFPTAFEMQDLADEAGIELNQAKNFFINYRKRNWQRDRRQQLRQEESAQPVADTSQVTESTTESWPNNTQQPREQGAGSEDPSYDPGRPQTRAARSTVPQKRSRVDQNGKAISR